jgi:hypothetical protein
MSHNVGFAGGTSVFQVGSVDDMFFFFQCAKRFVFDARLVRHACLFSDRLYKRYVDLKDFTFFKEVIKVVIDDFSSVNLSCLNGVNDIIISNSLSLDFYNSSSLYEVFSKYFKAIYHCLEISELLFNEHNYNQPLRVVISDMPYLFVDESRTLEEYDNLDGDPFWMRTPNAEFSNVEKIVGDGSEEMNVYTLNNLKKK